MLFHSGGTWALTVEVCRLYARHYGIEHALHIDDAGLEKQISELSNSIDVSISSRRLLESAEACIVVRERLRLAAQLWDVVVRVDLLREDAPDTIASARQAGFDLREQLEAPDDQTTSQMLDAIFCFRRSQNAPASIRIVQLVLALPSTGWPYLAAAIPDRLALAGVPPDANRLRLFVDQLPDRERPIFQRLGEVFVHHTGPRLLRIPRDTGYPAMVMAQFKIGSDCHEVEVGSIGFPDDGIALFDPGTGKRIHSAPAGTRIGLVSAAGLDMEGLSGFELASSPSSSGPRIWFGTVPAEPTCCAVRSGDGSTVFWLAPTGTGGSIHVSGIEVPRLKAGNSPCFQRWPRIWIDSQMGWQCRIIGPRGEEPVRRRGSLVLLQRPQPPPGRYRVSASFGEMEHSKTFVLLPPAMSFHARSSREGTVIQASSDGAPVNLSCRTPPCNGSGRLFLDPDVRGSIDVTLTIPCADGAAASMLLHWSVVAAPARATTVITPDGPPVETRSMDLLRGDGGLRVEGPPGSTFTVDVDGYRWIQRIGPDGDRFFPFAAIPPAALPEGDQPVHVTVRWDSGDTGRFDFIDETATHATAKLLSSNEGTPRVLMRVPRPVTGEVVLHAVRAWEPWRPAWQHPALLDSGASAGVWYSAPVPPEPGPYQVTLMVGDRRVVGLALQQCPEDAPPEAPEQLAPLSRALWAKSKYTEIRSALLARLQERDGRDVLAGIFANLHRYGTRWFKIAHLLSDTASSFRLEALLGCHDRRVEEEIMGVFDDLGVPVIATRYDDFTTILGRCSPAPETLIGWIDRIASYQQGLLLPAWMAWNGLMSAETIGHVMSVLKPWIDVTDPLRPLSEEHLERLQVPEDHRPDDVNWAPPRVRGLLEVRQADRRLREIGGRRGEQLRRAVRDQAAECHRSTQRDERRPLEQRGIPQSVSEVECAVFNMTRRMHMWRARKAPVRTEEWADVRILAEEYPLLMDYWLNRWAGLADKERTRR